MTGSSYDKSVVQLYQQWWALQLAYLYICIHQILIFYFDCYYFSSLFLFFFIVQHTQLAKDFSNKLKDYDSAQVVKMQSLQLSTKFNSKVPENEEKHFLV